MATLEPASDALMACICESTTRLRVQSDARHSVFGVFTATRRGAADAVYLDALRSLQQRDCAFGDFDVKRRCGVVQRLNVAVKELSRNRFDRVVWLEVFVNNMHRLHEFLREQNLQLLEAGRSDLLQNAITLPSLDAVRSATSLTDMWMTSFEVLEQ